MRINRFILDRLGMKPVSRDDIIAVKAQALASERREHMQVTGTIVAVCVVLLVLAAFSTHPGLSVLPIVAIAAAVVIHFSSVSDSRSRVNIAARTVEMSQLPYGLLQDYENDPVVRATIKALSRGQEGKLYQYQIAGIHQQKHHRMAEKVAGELHGLQNQA